MQKKVLNVGGNNKQIPLPVHYDGWEHVLLDIDPIGKPDIVADARELFHLPRNSFDAIYCSHNLEHYLRHHASKVLTGFWHLVKPEGFVEIRVPDLIEVMERMKRDNLDFDSILYKLVDNTPILVHDVFYGFGAQMEYSGEEFYAHKCGFSERSLRRFLHSHGFPWVASIRGNLEVRAFAFRKKPAAGILKSIGFDRDLVSESIQDQGLAELEERALKIWDAGDHACSAAMCEILIASGIETLELCLLLGEFALQKHVLNKAIEMFQKAASLDNESMQANAGYVRALIGAGKKNTATAHLKKLEKKDPDLAELIRTTL